jgi:excisionase family DNA binding protein
MRKHIDTDRDYITTPEAARRTGLSRIYLAQLLRKGTLEGFQLAREWFIYTDSLEKFLATPRKPGPKGPMKKTKKAEHQENSTSTPRGNDMP